MNPTRKLLVFALLAAAILSAASSVLAFASLNRLDGRSDLPCGAASALHALRGSPLHGSPVLAMALRFANGSG